MSILPSDISTNFVVKPSLLQNAGDGLFTKTDIAKNTLFPLPFSIKTISSTPPVLESKSHSGECYSLPLFVDYESDMNNKFVVDGIITTIENVPYKTLMPLYAHIWVSDATLMKCNDFAWEPGIFEDMYEFNTIRNKLDIVLNFNADMPVELCGITNDFIKKGCEVGTTYGFEYWHSGSSKSTEYTENI